MLVPRNAVSAASDKSGLVVMRLWHTVCGIYIWEYLTNLNYEWSVIRGRQRYRWTIWIYSISRLSCFLSMLLVLGNFSLTTEINCQAWILIGGILTSVGCYGLASLLIVLRIFAIWERNKFVVAIAAAIWIGNLGFQLSGDFTTRAIWVPAAKACVNTHLTTNVKGLSIGALVNDISLLLIMLVGLLRIRFRDGSFIDLAYVLWKQGVAWLIIATAAQVLQVVCLFLVPNDAYKSLFTLPALMTIVIAGTQTYRHLTYYGSTTRSSTGPDSYKLPKNGRMAQGNKDSSILHIPSNHMEVTVHKDYEEHAMSRMSRCGSHPNSDAKLADSDKPPQELDLGDDV